MVILVFKQKTAYERRISDWSSDVCSSDLEFAGPGAFSYDLTSGRPEVSFASPDPLNPAGIRPDFGRIQSVTNDDEEKYFYLDIEKQVEWGPMTALKFVVKYTDHERVAERFAPNGGVFTPALTCDRSPVPSADFTTRPQEARVGIESVATCRSGGSTLH